MPEKNDAEHDAIGSESNTSVEQTRQEYRDQLAVLHKQIAVEEAKQRKDLGSTIADTMTHVGSVGEIVYFVERHIGSRFILSGDFSRALLDLPRPELDRLEATLRYAHEQVSSRLNQAKQRAILAASRADGV